MLTCVWLNKVNAKILLVTVRTKILPLTVWLFICLNVKKKKRVFKRVQVSALNISVWPWKVPQTANRQFGLRHFCWWSQLLHSLHLIIKYHITYSGVLKTQTIPWHSNIHQEIVGSLKTSSNMHNTNTRRQANSAFWELFSCDDDKFLLTLI